MTLSPLTLARESAIEFPELAMFLADQAGDDPKKRALVEVIDPIALGAKPLAARVGPGRLPGDPVAITGVNESGDKQSALDMAAHDYLIEALRKLPVANVLSEEAEEPITHNPDSLVDVAMDPVDGPAALAWARPSKLSSRFFRQVVVSCARGVT